MITMTVTSVTGVNYSPRQKNFAMDKGQENNVIGTTKISNMLSSISSLSLAIKH